MNETSDRKLTNRDFVNGTSSAGLMNPQAAECKVERSLIDVVSITAERMLSIEAMLGNLEVMLFGPRVDQTAECSSGENVRRTIYKEAMNAFSTSVRVERLIENIIDGTKRHY